MIDIKKLREEPEFYKTAAKDKGADIDVERILALDEQLLNLKQELDKLREEKNRLAKEKADPESGRAIKEKIKSKEEETNLLEPQLTKLILDIPNPAKPDVKAGKDDSENEVLRLVGEQTKFNFEPKDYIALAEDLDLIDTKRAGKVSGSRFGYIKNELAILHFALIKYGLDLLLKEKFQPVLPPVMVTEKAMQAMGYLEHGGEDETYHFKEDKLYLVGTAEQSVGPYFMDEILEEKDLPIRFVGFSTCFRREAGSYGKDTRGILRVHQFDKLEMFSFCSPDKSDEEHEFLLSIEEKLMQGLRLPYRVIKMCTGDLGGPAARKYDIETWLPSENRYRETHSSSTCTDYQARRLNIKYKNNQTGKNEFIHTLNGTAFATGRTLLMILENYQQKDGSILVPEVLQAYCGFKEIKKK